MTCCRKPGCAFTRCGTPTARASRCCRGFTRLPGTFAWTTTERRAAPPRREERLEEMPEPAATPGRGSGGTPDLEALLAPLPESQREVIEMLKVAGMSLEEVARATSSSVGSVKQKAHRAYEKLRERLSGMGLGAGRAGGPS